MCKLPVVGAYRENGLPTGLTLTILRLTEVIALMSADLCALSQTPPSLPSSPPYEGMCGIMATEEGLEPPRLSSSESKSDTSTNSVTRQYSV